MSNPDLLPLRLIAPPPVMYIGTPLPGLAIHAFIPMEIFTATHVHDILGGLLLVVSGVFARWAFQTMRRVGTTGNPRKPSKALATDGPFRISRNPIYVAMTGMYIALAFLLNFAWLLVLLVPLLMFMQWGVIPREERYLTAKFGNEYAAYSSKVRRWL